MTTKKSTFITPVAACKYAWVNQPDTKFATNGEGKYKIRVLLDDNETNRAWVANVIETAKADAKLNGVALKRNHKIPFTFPEDLDEEEFQVAEGKERPRYTEDYRGKIFFEASSQFKPGQIDSELQELPEDVFIMSGDKVRVKLETNPYEGLGSGISLRLLIVQLVEKNSTFTGGGTGGVNTSGFDVIEHGFKSRSALQDKLAKMKNATQSELQSDDPDMAFFQDLVKK